MIGKLCSGPSGGSAAGCSRYILGYSLGAHEKDEDSTPEQRREAYHSLIQQSLEREDLGVGSIWSPTVGDGTRPAAVLAKNVTSFATADQEMDALGAVARSRRVREPVLHFVFSVNADESKVITNETLIRAAERALERIDLGQNATLFSVHRDTEHAHVHVAVASVNAQTLQAWERHRHWSRLSVALRESELEFKLHHDYGIAEVKEGRVQMVGREERIARGRQRQEDRLVDQARKYASDFVGFENERSWATDVVAPRLRECIETAQGRGEKPSWSEMHVVAAQYGTRLECDAQTGDVSVRLLERVEGKGRTHDDFGESTGREGRQTVAESAPIRLQRDDLIGLAPAFDGRADLLAAYAERETLLRAYRNVGDAEREFVQRIKSDPGLVSREIVNGGTAVFSVDDIDRYLAARVTDPDELSSLSEYVEQHDASLRILSVDTPNPLYTTVAQQTLEERVVAKATALTIERDSRWDPKLMDRAISDVEKERGFIISDEQRQLLSGLEHRLSWCNGDAGTGKTVTMQCLNRYAELSGRPIAGVTTAEAAAKKLQLESGAFSMNSARALTYEQHAGQRIVETNAIVMLDEVSMLDMSAANKLLDLARERGASIIGIGDAAQLPAIAAGDAHRIICDVAKQHGTYSELHEVRRQRDGLEWMRPIVADLGRSIREGDAAGVDRNIATMAQRDVFEFHADRTATLSAAARVYTDARERGEQVVLNCATRIDARHLNKEIRARLEMPLGTPFRTSQGVAGVVAGDRIVMLRNDRNLDVLNGNTGTVQSVERSGKTWTITTELDDGKTVRFNPDRYRDWGHGYATTTHKSQGQSVSTDIYVMTNRLSDARLAHVGWTRGESSLSILVSQTAYADAGELARGVSDRLEAKADVILYKELEQKYGGPNTFWAMNVRRALQEDTDPLRQEHRRDLRALDERRNEALATVGERCQKAMAGATAEEKKAIEREYRSATKQIFDAHKPKTFVQWAGERNRAATIERRAQQVERAGELRRTRELQRRPAPSRDQSLQDELRRALDRDRNERAQKEQHRER